MVGANVPPSGVDRDYSGGELLLFYFVGVKYVYECVVMSVREVFTFESDEPLARGDVFMHARHVYEVMESPQLGLAVERVSVRLLQ
jgi:hypothetical protein